MKSGNVVNSAVYGKAGRLRQRFRDLAAPLRHHNFRMIWIAQVLSEVGDWSARVALTVLVFRKSGSAAEQALVFALSVVPWLGIGQYLSAIADRFNRRFVMVVCDLCRAGIFLSMVVPQPVGSLLALSFLAALFTPPFETTRSAIIPESVPEEVYPDAVSLSSATFQFTLLIGLFAGSALVLLGPRVALAINASSFAASALVLSFVRRRRGAERRDHHPTKARDGLLAVWRDPIVRWLGGMCILSAMCVAAAEHEATVFASTLLPDTKFGLGILYAVVPMGTLAAALVFGAKGRHRAVARRAALIAFLGAGFAACGFVISGLPTVSGIVGYFGLGVSLACTTVAGAVFGQRLPAVSRAAAFSILQGGLAISQGLGAALGGLLADSQGVRQACLYASVGALVISGIGMLYVPADHRGRFDLDAVSAASA